MITHGFTFWVRLFISALSEPCGNPTKYKIKVIWHGSKWLICSPCGNEAEAYALTVYYLKYFIFYSSCELDRTSRDKVFSQTHKTERISVDPILFKRERMVEVTHQWIKLNSFKNGNTVSTFFILPLLHDICGWGVGSHIWFQIVNYLKLPWLELKTLGTRACITFQSFNCHGLRMRIQIFQRRLSYPCLHTIDAFSSWLTWLTKMCTYLVIVIQFLAKPQDGRMHAWNR